MSDKGHYQTADEMARWAYYNLPAESEAVEDFRHGRAKISMIYGSLASRDVLWARAAGGERVIVRFDG